MVTGDQFGASVENGIKEFMLATASELNSSTTLTFNHKLTVLKMTLTLPEDVEGRVNKVTVSGLHNKAIYDLSKTTGAYAYTDEGKGDITATYGGAGFFIDIEQTITAYVAVFPESVTTNQVTIKATVGDNEYSYTIANTRTLQENQVVPVKVTLAAPKKNFKSEYTADDYKTWSTDNCGSAVSYDDMCKYLGAGVYYDNGSTSGAGYYDGNVQTYTVDSREYHAGLWVMKKAYIDGFSEGTAKQSNSATPTSGRPADINKYFFLPSAGFYDYGYFSLVGSYGRYWSSSPVGDVDAYYLGFGSSSAGVNYISRDLGYLPMAAE